MGSWATVGRASRAWDGSAAFRKAAPAACVLHVAYRSTAFAREVLTPPAAPVVPCSAYGVSALVEEEVERETAHMRLR